MEFNINSKGSDIYHRLQVAPLKRLYSQFCSPDAINFCGGLPQHSLFPFEKIAVAINENENFFLSNGSPSLSLNYTRGDGIPELREWIYTHTKKIHGEGTFKTCLTIGSTDAFAKIIQLLDGDTILFDKLAYNSSISSCQALGKNILGVDFDEYGMMPSSLRQQTLLARQQGLHPNVVCCVPVAQNPCGMTMSEDRKREIYQVCQELELIIIEDGNY